MRVAALSLICLAVSASGYTLPSTHLLLRQPLPPVARSSAVSMGRAENRAAAKRAKKKGGGGVKTAKAQKTDAVPLETVKARLREVPVFVIFGVADGSPNLFLDEKEAERAAASLGGGRVEITTLDQVYFDQKNVLKPSAQALQDAANTPERMTEDIRVPLFAIDGLEVQDKETGKASLPLFFSRKELLGFATTCMDAPEQRVMAADLGVVVSNMIQGPAGLLRGARFFPTEGALQYVDSAIAEAKKKAALFPEAAGVGTSVAERDQPDGPRLPNVPKQSGGGGLFPGDGGGGLFPGGGGGIFPS